MTIATTVTLREHRKPVRVDLPDTASFKGRSYEWVPAPRGETGYLGILIVGQKKERTTYQVDETSADGMPGRAYLLAKQHQLDRSGRRVKDAADVYRVFVGVDLNRVHCNCSGFGRHGHCKHTDAVRDLMTREPGQQQQPATATAQHNSTGVQNPPPSVSELVFKCPICTGSATVVVGSDNVPRFVCHDCTPPEDADPVTVECHDPNCERCFGSGQVFDADTGVYPCEWMR